MNNATHDDLLKGDCVVGRLNEVGGGGGGGRFKRSAIIT